MLLFCKVPFGLCPFPSIVHNTQKKNNYFQNQYEKEQENRKKIYEHSKVNWGTS